MAKARVDKEEHDAAVDIMLDEGEDNWGPVQEENLPGLDRKGSDEVDDQPVK